MTEKSYLDKVASLSPLARRIMLDKGTEAPHSGCYFNFQGSGTYLCRRCGLALFRASAQFKAGCGWPSFDKELSATIATFSDEDGLRTEIRCIRCDSHLGHVFYGERFTKLNTRFCVNSLAIDYVLNPYVLDSEEIIVAGGCFWRIDYLMKQEAFVLKTEAGYCGGHLDYPGYDEVCQGESGHFEAVRVVYEPSKINLREVLDVFFKSHDFSQANGQGVDIGQQYQTAVFYFNEQQRQIISAMLAEKKAEGLFVATKIIPAAIFWPAEDYHQDYYSKHPRSC